ncbi:diguanylate cyclase domain-containing protein [Candidatus Reidiella endopervernicosa]|uniref:Diguanylate cyclase n=1 Tax=Candidatus Reidiella endopervernicosa TaxID=2738883 RepID=A0A6N0HSL9_9GAMM|nr:diguanylate cyclase [Candidatus Reidiella endopervernicosa]
MTGLPNRDKFIDSLACSVAIAQRDERKVAILFLDLDNFKQINDSLGPRLRSIADRGGCEDQRLVADGGSTGECEWHRCR